MQRKCKKCYIDVFGVRRRVRFQVSVREDKDIVAVVNKYLDAKQ